MPQGTTGIIVMLLSFVLTFLVARTLGKWWRRRKAEQALHKARANETRQVRRARERRHR